jgi:CheY-like chemotaxis protein
VAEVGILIIDDDIVSQRALKNVLDSEGWHVRIVPLASHAMAEIASGVWSLVIVNVALTDVRGPIFTTLRDLAQGQADAPADAEIDATRPKRIRVLFLVPILAAKHAQPVLEQEGLPYSLKPYHLNEFLEKVGDLLVEAGALETPIRSMDFSVRRRRAGSRSARDKRNGAMFASREDYQMSEEEMVDYERQEEEDKKKREKQQKDREHL